MDIIKKNLTNAGEHAIAFLKWLLISSVTGLAAGGVGILFSKGLGLANGFRNEHPEIILGLPVAGIIIVSIYKLAKFNDKGTNLVLSAEKAFLGPAHKIRNSVL